MIRKIVVGLISFALLLLIAYFFFAQSQKPTYSGSADLPGLDSEVEVYFDEFGIPHIFAEKESDAFMALGYVHAQDRLWQMELVRRIAAGRLSELFGPDLVETDKFFRGLGIEYESAKAMQKLDTTSDVYLLSQAYLDGINRFIESGKTPIEFRLLGVEKEKYDLNDIYNVFGYMSFGFAQAHKTDPLLSHLQEKLGSDYIADLDINIDPRTTLIKNARRPGALAQNMVGAMDQILGSSPVPPFIGSNSWVIGPEKSKNKQVIFANDPHIGFAQPAVWYQAHLVTPNYEMYGFHLALTPFPLLAHNRNYAYGMTMLENDDLDFYRESEEAEFASREEVIKVKGEDDLIFTVRSGKHGPIMNDLLEVISQEEPVAMDWIYTRLENEMLQVSYEISHAQSLTEFRDGVSKIHAPGLNIMYGDAKGNIAWFGAAQLYSRAEGVYSKFILDGADPTQDHLMFLDFDQNPQAINPRWDYVYSANNQPEEVDGKLYPGYYLPEDRAKKIVQLLEAKDDFSQSDVEEMIYNVESSISADLAGLVLRNTSMVKMSDLEKEAIEILKTWDGSYEKESIAPTIYFTLIYNILENTFKDEMGEVAFNQFIKAHLSKRQIAKQIRMLKSVWWDDILTEEVKENREEIFTRSFHEAIGTLKDRYGSNLKEWTWKNTAKVTHKHTFDKSGLLRSFFNVGPFSTNGGNEVINNQLFQINGTGAFEITAGPSTRRVIDFSNVENARAILPTGQSGNVFSKHYSNQAQKYLDGEFVKMLLNEEQIKASEDRLMLKPSSEF
ncbi:MAG: penicillin acylase family protein [Lutimonas sp.]